MNRFSLRMIFLSMIMVMGGQSIYADSAKKRDHHTEKKQFPFVYTFLTALGTSIIVDQAVRLSLGKDNIREWRFSKRFYASLLVVSCSTCILARIQNDDKWDSDLKRIVGACLGFSLGFFSSVTLSQDDSN